MTHFREVYFYFMRYFGNRQVDKLPHTHIHTDMDNYLTGKTTFSHSLKPLLTLQCDDFDLHENVNPYCA